MTPTDRSAAETIRLLNAENAALLQVVADLTADLERADDEIERCIADRELMRDERDVARASGSIW